MQPQNKDKYMKKIILFGMFCIAASFAFAGSSINTDSIRSGTYRIVINADASESEKWAAEELRYWLFRISGEYIPVQWRHRSYDGLKIVLGHNDSVKAKTGRPAPAPDDESFHYFSDGGDVFIYGGKESGTMYGVFAFLENEFGCRWYTPKVTVVPWKKKLVFEKYDYKSSPGIAVRNNFSSGASDPLWAARNKMNGGRDFRKDDRPEEPVNTFYPNVSVLQSNIKTFKESKNVGLMEQFAYQVRGGEFSELKAYLVARLLWNPDINTDEIIEDFMCGYYGRSGMYVKQYFDLLQSLVTPDNQKKTGLMPDDKLFTDDFVNKAVILFEKAEMVADDKAIQARVALTSLSVLYLKCIRHPAEGLEKGIYDKLLAIAAKEGITYLAEYGQTIESFKKHVEGAR